MPIKWEEAEQTVDSCIEVARAGVPDLASKDHEWWRSVFDRTGVDTDLTDDELDIIARFFAERAKRCEIN